MTLQFYRWERRCILQDLVEDCGEDATPYRSGEYRTLIVAGPRNEPALFTTPHSRADDRYWQDAEPVIVDDADDEWYTQKIAALRAAIPAATPP